MCVSCLWIVEEIALKKNMEGISSADKRENTTCWQCINGKESVLLLPPACKDTSITNSSSSPTMDVQSRCSSLRLCLRKWTHSSESLFLISISPMAPTGHSRKEGLLRSGWTWRDTSRPYLTDTRSTKQAHTHDTDSIFFSPCSMIEEYSGPCHATALHRGPARFKIRAIYWFILQISSSPSADDLPIYRTDLHHQSWVELLSWEPPAPLTDMATLQISNNCQSSDKQ
jgi:hypothetical protein